MTEQTGRQDGLLKCPSCGRMVPELFTLTGEDIQRRYSPGERGIYWRGCSDCRNMFRTAARLESNYTTTLMFRDVLIAVPVLFIVLTFLFVFLAGSAFLAGAVIFLTAGAVVLREVGGRYAFTHSLAWSVRDRKVLLGLSVVGALVLVVLFPL